MIVFILCNNFSFDSIESQQEVYICVQQWKNWEMFKHLKYAISCWLLHTFKMF